MAAATDALEPFISAEIMKVHHTKHHQAYVTNLNAAMDQCTHFLAANCAYCIMFWGMFSAHALAASDLSCFRVLQTLTLRPRMMSPK